MRPSGSKVYRVHHLRCGKQTETTCAAQPERSKDTWVALPAFCAESFSTSTCGRFGKKKFDSKSPVQKDQNKKHLGGWIENDKNNSKRIWIYKCNIYIYISCLSRSCFLMARIRKVPLKHPTHIQHYLPNYRLLTCASSNALWSINFFKAILFQEVVPQRYSSAWKSESIVPRFNTSTTLTSLESVSDNKIKKCSNMTILASPRSTRSCLNCRRFLPPVGIGSGRLSSSDSSSSTLQKIRWSFDRWLLSPQTNKSSFNSMWVLFSSPQKLSVIPQPQSSSMLHHAKLKVICIPKLESKLLWFWLCTAPVLQLQLKVIILSSRRGRAFLKCPRSRRKKMHSKPHLWD